MRLGVALVVLAAGLAGLASLSAASPLQLGPPPSDSPREGSAPPPARSRIPGAGSEGAGVIPAPAFVQRLTEHISLAQRQLNQTLSREMRQIRETGSPVAMLTVGLVAFVYGVLHAAGPGHGKLVVSAFFLGREARIIKGVIMGGLVSVLQTFSAIAIVLVLVFILGRGGFDVVQQSVWVEVASYGLIVLVGLYMIYAAVTGRHLGHHHGEGSTSPPTMATSTAAWCVAAGLTPVRQRHHHPPLCPRERGARHRDRGHAGHGPRA